MPRGRVFRRIVMTLVLCAAGILTSVCTAQTTASFSPESLLNGPERHDFDWNVRVSGPFLTFQERYLVQVHITLSPSDLKVGDAASELHFLLKVAGADGQWFPDEDHTHIDLPANPNHDLQVRYNCGLYLRPGKYVIVAVAYDDVSHKATVRRLDFHFSAPKHDPLPQLDSMFPAVEFLGDKPEFAGESQEPRSQEWVDKEEEHHWNAGSTQVSLPVHNATPVCIDLVLNVSNWVDPYRRIVNPDRRYRANAIRMLQVGDLLSHLQLAHGCMHISAVDINETHVLYFRGDAASFDWAKAQKTIMSRDPDVIDVATLKKRPETATFLRGFLGNLLSDPCKCGPADTPARHVVIIVGGSYEFPSQAHKPKGAWPDKPFNCSFYYWRVDGRPYDDDIDKLLKSVNAHRAHMDDGHGLRTALAQLMSDLEQGSGGGTPSASQ